MKKRKRLGVRLLCAIVALATVLTTMPFVAFADENAQVTVQDVTQITTAEEFAAMDATGSYRLANDITITTPYQEDFKGTFDGQGHTVTLNISETVNYVGMFRALVGGAVVKNVITAGSVSGPEKNYIGGIAGSADADFADILIENCKNTATVSGYRSVGGIVGEAAGANHRITISGCANEAAVTGANTKVGGIVGSMEYTHVITNCSNTGDITGFNNYAGIAGRAAWGVSVSNCYTTGSITACEASTNAGYAIVGSAATSGAATTVTNCYALEGTGSALAYSSVTVDSASSYKTSSDMQSEAFASTLGEGYIFKSGSYPAHSWEVATVGVAFEVTPANALISVNGATYTGSSTVYLPAGTYEYSISAEGYKTKTGTVTVAEGADGLYATPASVTETLEEDPAAYSTVTFTLVPADAALVIKDGETEISAQSDGSYRLLKEHKYSYTASRAGYEDESGDFSVEEDTQTKTITLKQISSITLSGTYKTEYYVGDELDTTGLVVTVHYSDESTKDITEGFSTSGFDSSAAASEQTITVSFGGKTASYKISIAKTITFDDFFTDVSGITAVNYMNGETAVDYGFVPAKDGTENVLATNSQDVNYSKAALTITATSAVRLSFDYKVSTETSYDKFTITKSGTLLKTESGDKNWASYSVILSAGDTLTLLYTKDSYSRSYDDTVYLKNFATETMRTLSFTGVPESATLELKSGDTVVPANADGTYTLSVGLYTYKITSFDYEDVTGSVVIAGEDVTQAITMTEKTKYDITFNVVRPEGITADYSIEVKYGDKVLTPVENVYKLPAGEYTYKITCEGCDDKTGTFAVENSGKAVYAELPKKLLFADFFTELTDKITAADDSSYPFSAIRSDDGNYLQSSNNTSNSKSTVTITAEKPSKISFKYMISESGSTWTTSNYGMIVSLNGTQLSRAEKVSTEWEDYTVLLDAGDKLEITYSCYCNEYAWSKDDEDWLKLKDFTASPVTAVSFVLEPAEAEVSVTKDGAEVQAQNGKYLLEAGSYKYTISAFGYKNITAASLVVDGTKDADTITAALEESEKVDITLKILPAGISETTVVLKNSAGTQMTPESGSAYRLPKDEMYSLSVTADGYIEAERFFESDKSKEIEVTLEPAGAAWDGTTKTEPQKENDIYLISNAEELAWFANKVTTTPAINGRLTANINLGGKTWTGFGTYDYSDPTSGYAGVFDGNGKTISGLSGTGGLVNCLGSAGTIKNLTVIGNINAATNTGGIANTTSGTIEGCAFRGVITSNNGYGCTGGIAGRCQKGNIIKNCFSNALLKNTYQYYNATLNLGGIAGYTYGSIENCYFTGSVKAEVSKTTNKGIGGIAGQFYADGTMTNVYVAASVEGPEAGTGAVIGINKGTLKNVYCMSGSGQKTIADNQGSGVVTEKTQADMKKGLFVYTLGEGYNQDTDFINGGYPILDWQGGSEPTVPEFEQAVEKDKAALEMFDAKRAAELAAEKAEVDAEIEAEGGIEALQELFENYELTIELFYEMNGIDLEDDGSLEVDAENRYQLMREAELLLPDSGSNGSAITWSCSDNTVIDPATGKVTLPAEGKTEVKLTATLSMGTYTDTAEFNFVVWSDDAVDAEILAAIKEETERRGNAIQPLQIYNHTNVTEAMDQYLGRKDYAVFDYDGEGIKVEFVSPGKKALPNDSKNYIDESGNVTYFTGTGTGYGTKNAIYDDVQFKLTLNNSSTIVNMRVNIGWDVDYVEQMIAQALEEVTWDTIKDKNTNTSYDDVVEGWPTTIVNDYVTKELILPCSLSKYTWLTIGWSAVNGSAYAVDNGDGTYTATVERPAKGEPDQVVTLNAVGKFNFWDDYTYEEMNSQDVQQEPAVSRKFFQVTVPANDQDQSEEIAQALEKYPTLLTDFVDKTTPVDSSAVTADIQMPRPSVLEDEGIMPDRYNQKVTMTSSNTDVLEFYGYHAMVYRPLPGEDEAVVEYTITITDRRNNATLAEKTFQMTVKPLAQSEIDEAAAQMEKLCTEEAYWEGIKGENTDKNNVTSSLKPFAEILYKDGTTEYVRGAVNLTFGGIEVDDLPGYDPMGSQPWREFRSSRNSIITCEQLLLTQPQYNTKVTIDSVLTHSEYGKYWEKFSSNAKYAMFEQFYKQPVSVTVTVKGKIDEFDPDEDKEISVSLSVDGCGFENFKNITGYTYKSTVAEEKSVWDALEECFIENSYTIEGGGSYVSAVTDSNGVTLEELEHGVYSGWMYTVNGVAPSKALKDMMLEDGDVIRFYYTDGSEIEDQITAAEVEELIDKITNVDELTLNDAKTVSDAEAAYNKLTEAQKEFIPQDKKTKLSNAVKKIAELKEEAQKSFEDAYKTTGDYLAALLKGNEGLGSEWVVLGLARADRTSDIDTAAYYKAIVEAVKKKGSAQLSNTKSTENSRVILALTSLGKDVTDVGGYNLLAPLANLDFVNKQGTNGAIWALTALDSHEYEIPALPEGSQGTQTTRENLIQAILDAQLEDGGFAMSGNSADPDMTAMAIQALANYKADNEAVAQAIEKAVECLSNLQDENDGGFLGSDGKSSESCAQVIVALTKLGIDPSADARFVKNGHSVLDALLGFYVEGGGFEHVAGGGVNGMASEQGYYALASYSRMLADKTSLYDMSDVTINKNTDDDDKPDDKTTPADDKKGNDKNNDNKKSDKDNPKSGDENNMSLWLMLLIAALSTGTAAAVSARRKKGSR